MSTITVGVARKLHLVDDCKDTKKRWCPKGFPGSIVEIKSSSAVGNNLKHKTTKVDSPRCVAFKETLDDEKGTVVGDNRDSGLRAMAWNGVSAKHRPTAWKVLTGYSPAAKGRREKELSRKRKEYQEYVTQYYETAGMILEDGSHMVGGMGATLQELEMRKQIHIDVPRTLHEYSAFQTQFVQSRMERLLYIWSIRHPASGYVQGINDLTTPFFAVFLSEHLNIDKLMTAPIHECQEVIEALSDEDKMGVEADSFWCLSYLLRHVQDNYTFAQPGIQLMLNKMKAVVTKTDPALAKHLEDQGIAFMQFAFRWMNCLLVRELPLFLVIRLWDTYMAEGENFPALHVYVCSAFLMHWSPELLKMDFAEMLMFLQSLNKRHVYLKDLEQWVSHAYVLQHMFEGSTHLEADS